MTTPAHDPNSPPEGAFEDVEVRGHIIDSLILPKVLDGITAAGGTFRIKDIAIGQGRTDPSFARDRSAAPPAKTRCTRSSPRSPTTAPCPSTAHDCRLVAADMDGAFPEGFYSTTNQRTEVRLGGHWIEVADQEMDCGIVVDAGGARARCMPMTDVAARHADRRRPRGRARVSRRSGTSRATRSSS